MPLPKSWPHDAAGKTLPHDHAEIGPDDFLIRYTTPNDLHYDEATTMNRVTSGAYTEATDGGMSTLHHGWMTEAGLEIMHYAKQPMFGAVRLRVGDLRTIGLKVGYDPQPDNPHHCAVWGLSSGSRRKRVQRLAQTVKKCQGED
jgi:hypothetical protein